MQMWNRFKQSFFKTIKTYPLTSAKITGFISATISFQGAMYNQRLRRSLD